ncbi:trypsin-like peptidase domain-containing protein [Streptomyces sp. NPDC002889]|uniref:trypsin-like peptidase domain-containing protein n=1 Tax=Streptomyces sp. NPDC002889 TaxID=3364669 RepID=UPI0036CAF2DA
MGRGQLATLVRICDMAGRPRGTGFVADGIGTVVTSHEAVDGQTRVMLHAPDGRACLAEGDAITALPASGVALLRTDGLGMPPLPISTRDTVRPGTYVRLAAHGWREARVLGTTRAGYSAADHSRVVVEALELAIGTDGSDALHFGSAAAGGPVLDARTGAVLAVLGTSLRCGHPAARCAVPLRTPDRSPDGPLAALLRRNGATAPAYGDDLNLAAVLELTSRGRMDPPPVERPAVVRQLDRFADGATALVAGLVGAPGTGRTSELAALAARRAQAPAPAPTLWLRGADLCADDMSLADAAARVLSASGTDAVTAGVTPDRVAHLAHEAGRPLLVVLDGAEEAPPLAPARLSLWTANTVAWLTATGTRLVIGCRPEHWEQAGALYPPGALFDPAASGEPLRVPGPRTGAYPDARTASEPWPAAQNPAGTVPGVPYGRSGLPSPDVSAGAVGRPARAPAGLLPADTSGRPVAGRGVALALRVDGPAPSQSPVGTSGRPMAARGAPALWLEGPAASQPAGLPPAVDIGPLSPDEARRMREHYRVPAGALGVDDERHPLVLRIYTEVRDALGGDVAGRPVREDLLGAHLDLVCLRIASRNAADVPGSAVRRLAASVAGQVHEAARRCLGTGLGELDRATFEELFAEWGPAVLAEGLLVPAGGGYRFGHEEVADWIHGAHLDLDAALDRLVHRPWLRTAPPVPRHRLGIVIHSLLRLGRFHGAAALERRLAALARALESGAETPDDARWWAARLVAETLRRVPDAQPYLGVLRLLVPQRGAAEFGPAFWERIALPDACRLELLRRLVPADPPHGSRAGRGAGRRYLDVVAARLAADPEAVQPLLCRWFTDTTPLAVGPDAAVRPTVATAAQALLHALRGHAVDGLTEALVASDHPRAHELLAALVDDEPSALCRAVARWAHDPRPRRRAAAAVYAPVTAARATTPADHALLRHAALALLSDTADPAVRGPALALLVQDPVSRANYVDTALAAYAAGEPHLPSRALAAALGTHTEPVLAAFRARLLGPRDRQGADSEDGEILGILAEIEITALGPARRAAALVCEFIDHRPEAAPDAAAYLDRLIEQGPAAGAVLFPLVIHLLRGRRPQVRSALAPVLAAPGSAVSRSLRAELLDVLLEYEQYAARDLAVLEAVLRAAAHGCGARTEARTRALVHRTGRVLARRPGGAACLDRLLVELARELPRFALLLAGWLAAAPQEWAAVVGPGTRRLLATHALPVPMPTASRGHGSLRPA